MIGYLICFTKNKQKIVDDSSESESKWSNCWPQNRNNELKDAKMLRKTEETAELRDNDLWDLHITQTFYPLLILK